LLSPKLTKRLISTARELESTDAAISAPCSVKAQGSVGENFRRAR